MTNTAINPFLFLQSILPFGWKFVPSKHLSRLATTRDLAEYLQSKNHAEACQNFSACDPWQYEPLMLDALIHEQQHHSSEAIIDHLRGLIRAGSWMTYARPSAVDLLADLRRLQTQFPHQSLPQTRAALDQQLTGYAVRPAVEEIERLQNEHWLELKKRLASHGVSITKIKTFPDARRSDMEAIEHLRKIRDTLYFRLLHPDWIQH